MRAVRRHPCRLISSKIREQDARDPQARCLRFEWLHMPRWTHITINVSDLERSIQFYTSLCGLSIVRDRRPEGRHNVWLGSKPEAGEDPIFVLVLIQNEVKARLDHFGFQCESNQEVDRIAELARAQNILIEPPQDIGGVVGYFTMVRDPDGHLIEFTAGQPLRGL